MFPTMTPVSSTTVSGYSFDPVLGTLYISFTNRTVYVYGKVPTEVVSEVFNGEGSAGSKFSAMIKLGGFACVRLA
jgi:hypothetical protein